MLTAPISENKSILNRQINKTAELLWCITIFFKCLKRSVPRNTFCTLIAFSCWAIPVCRVYKFDRGTRVIYVLSRFSFNILCAALYHFNLVDNKNRLLHPLSVISHSKYRLNSQWNAISQNNHQRDNRATFR